MPLVVIPTYNEAAVIERSLDAVLERPELADVDVLVVDDASPDGTAGLVRAHPAYGRRVFLLGRPVKDGLGGAYRHGFGWAQARGYTEIVQMDADGSHPAAAISAMLHALGTADLVIGSRYVPGGRTVDWPWHRSAISRVGNAYVRSVLGLRTRDVTAGFRAFHAAALAEIGMAGSESNGYCFQVESTWRADRRGLRVVEVPITFTERRDGVSKMSGEIVREALWRVLTWRIGEVRARTRDVVLARP